MNGHPVTPCGCRLESTHRRGDRLQRCEHGLWRVRAEVDEHVRYDVTPVAEPAR